MAREPERAPVFLERRSYRQRRLMDALRLLPVAGLMLWLLPLFWPAAATDDVQPMRLSDAILYVFGVWMALILAAMVLWRLLRPTLSDSVPPHGDESG